MQQPDAEASPRDARSIHGFHMRRGGLLAAAVMGLVLAVGCAQSRMETAAPGAPWRSPYQRDHPLAGQLWHVPSGRFVSQRGLVDALLAADFVLLGEKHDNADHHRFQAWAIEQLFATGRRPAAALEMIRSDQAPALNRFRQQHPGDAAGLGEALQWQDSGWPAWPHYRPVVEPFIEAGAAVLPGSLARSELRLVVAQGLGAVGPDRVARLGLDRLPAAAVLDAIETEIVASHCGLLPESMTRPMVMATLLKDAVMADALGDGARRANGGGAVLIAGNGHVRRDRGVPWHLARLEPDRSLVSVGLLEVVEGQRRPGDYGSPFGSDRPPFDFVWFSPRADEEDPCDKYAESLIRAKERHLEKPGTP